MGIDPGFAIVGYGVVDYEKTIFSHVRHGVIRTEAGQPQAERLQTIYRDLQTLFSLFRPDAVAVEQLFFNTNQKTGIQVSQARGVILLATMEAGVLPAEYTPLQVKQAVVGYGRAEKHQVMEMVRLMLRLKAAPKPDDAADGLALAICHAQAMGSPLAAKQ